MKEVTVEELREEPEQLIAAIRDGERVSIVEAGQPVATVRPIPRAVAGVPFPGRDFDFGPRPRNLDIDPAEAILSERERERSLKKYGL